MRTTSISWLAAISAVSATPFDSSGFRAASLMRSSPYVAPDDHISLPFIPAREIDRATIFEGNYDSNSNITENGQSRNWSGGIITSSGDAYKTITGTFTVPHPQPPSASSTPTAGGSRPFAGAAWVGIDGAQNHAALLQAGVDWRVTAAGETSYNGWVEWFPISMQPISGWAVSAGHTVTVTCSSTSPTTGTCTLDNVSTGQSVTRTLNAPGPTSTLTGVNAEWIVEDFSQGGQQVPFANFGTVQFSGCTAGTQSGATVNAQGAKLVDLDTNGKIVTSASEPDSSDIVVQYTG